MFLNKWWQHRAQQPAPTEFCSSIWHVEFIKSIWPAQLNLEELSRSTNRYGRPNNSDTGKKDEWSSNSTAHRCSREERVKVPLNQVLDLYIFSPDNRECSRQEVEYYPKSTTRPSTSPSTLPSRLLGLVHHRVLFQVDTQVLKKLPNFVVSVGNHWVLY